MFSVVIPLYNKKEYVASCFGALRAQRHADFEAIVVDDGSTDGSYEAVTRAVAGDSRFVIVRQENSGVSAARNRAIALAKRRYVAFLDADDTWKETHLSLAAEILAHHPEAGLYSSGFRIVRGSELLFDSTRFAPPGRLLVNEGFFETWVSTDETPVATSSTIIDRHLLLEVGSFPRDLALGEDLLTWLKIIERSSYVLVNVPTVSVRHDDLHSLSRAPSLAAIEGHNRLIEVLSDMAAERGELGALSRKYNRVHCHMLMESGSHSELVKFLAAHPAALDVRTWLMAVLELAGVRSMLRGAYRRFSSPGRLSST